MPGTVVIVGWKGFPYAQLGTGPRRARIEVLVVEHEALTQEQLEKLVNDFLWLRKGRTCPSMLEGGDDRVWPIAMLSHFVMWYEETYTHGESSSLCFRLKEKLVEAGIASTLGAQPMLIEWSRILRRNYDRANTHLTAREEHAGFEQLRLLLQQDQIERRRESEERRKSERSMVVALEQLKIAYNDSVTKGIAQNSSMTSTLLSMRTLFETKQFKSPAPSPKCARPVESMLAQSNRLEETIGASGEQVGPVIEVPSATAHLTVPTSTVLTVNDMQYHPGSQPGRHLLTSLGKVTGVAYMEHCVAGTTSLTKQDAARGRVCIAAFRAVALKSEKDKLVQATGELELNDLLMKLNYRLVGRMAALFIEAGQDAPKKAQAGGVLLVNTIDNISKALDQIGGKYRSVLANPLGKVEIDKLPTSRAQSAGAMTGAKRQRVMRI